MGMPETPETLQAFMEQMDLNKDGTINKNEYYHLVNEIFTAKRGGDPGAVEPPVILDQAPEPAPVRQYVPAHVAAPQFAAPQFVQPRAVMVGSPVRTVAAPYRQSMTGPAQFATVP